MQDFVINVSRVEELQTLNDKDELDRMFAKAKSTVVNGAKTILARKSKSGSLEKFDEIDNLEDLEKYRKNVFKYLG